MTQRGGDGGVCPYSVAPQMGFLWLPSAIRIPSALAQQPDERNYMTKVTLHSIIINGKVYNTAVMLVHLSDPLLQLTICVKTSTSAYLIGVFPVMIF